MALFDIKEPIGLSISCTSVDFLHRLAFFAVTLWI
mgnify:FL=1